MKIMLCLDLILELEEFSHSFFKFHKMLLHLAFASFPSTVLASHFPLNDLLLGITEYL